MKNLTIKTITNDALNIPLSTPVSGNFILGYYDPELIDEDGNVVKSEASLDLSQIPKSVINKSEDNRVLVYNKVGSYNAKIILTPINTRSHETYTKNIQINIIEMFNDNNEMSNDKSNKIPNWAKYALTGLSVAVICIVIFSIISSHNKQQDNNAIQQSQIAQNSSTAADLSSKTNSLNNAIKNYQQDKDVNKLESTVNDTENDLNNTTNELQNQINDLKNNQSNIQNQLNQILSSIQNWFSSLFGDRN